MTKIKRIIVEVTMPPAIAALIVVILLAFDGPLRPKTVILVFLFSYAYAILPSCVFASVLELAFTRGLSPYSWRSVAISAVLGLGCGAVIGAVFPEPSAVHSYLPMILIGTAVGAVTGLILKLSPQRSVKNA